MHQLATKKYEPLSTPKTLDELREEFSKKYTGTNSITFHEIKPFGPQFEGHKLPVLISLTLNARELSEYINQCGNTVRYPELLSEWLKFLSNISKVLKETPNSEILRAGEIDFIFKIGSRAQQSNDPYRHIWVEEYYYKQVSNAITQISDKYNSKVKLLNERFQKQEIAKEEKIKRDKERTEWLNSEQSRKLIEDEAKKRIEQEKLQKIEDEAQRRIKEEKQRFEEAVKRRMDELRV